MADAEAESPEQAPEKRSDLPVRIASALVMLAVATFAVLRGGMWLNLFVIVVSLICFAEFVRLAIKAVRNTLGRVLTILLGGTYLAVATHVLLQANSFEIVLLIGAVIAVDVGAYFAGRSIGGPKIAPRISPSKTWSGYFGGAIAASAFLAFAGSNFSEICRTFTPRFPMGFDDRCHFADWPVNLELFVGAAALGIVLAAIAQAGDFLESWLKRRAGMKDSSNLIPGHGGVFDRVDGLIAVCFVIGIIQPFYA